MENTTVSVYARIQDPLKFVQEFGLSLAKSQMFGCSNPEQGQVMAMACLCEGTNPLEVAKKYYIIKGRLTKRADAMLAEFRERGGKHTIVERTTEAAEVELSIDGKTHRFRLTFEDAKSERFLYEKDGKTLKDNWATPRGRMQMLWARVVSDGVRSMAPEVVAGTYTPEEVRDFDGGAVVQPGEVVSRVASFAPSQSAETQSTAEVGNVQQSDEGEIVEAEFTIVDPPKKEVVIECEEVTRGPGFATREQLQLLKNLIVDVCVPMDAQLGILAKRGAHSWKDLTEVQAAEIIDGLEARLRPKS